MTRIALAVLAAILPGGASAAGTAAYDGTWHVTVLNASGPCERAARFPVAIRDGAMRYAGPEAYRAEGRALRGGRVRGMIATGSARAKVRGRLRGTTGQGTWTASGLAACSGSWAAMRQE